MYYHVLFDHLDIFSWGISIWNLLSIFKKLSDLVFSYSIVGIINSWRFSGQTEHLCPPYLFLPALPGHFLWIQSSVYLISWFTVDSVNKHKQYSAEHSGPGFLSLQRRAMPRSQFTPVAETSTQETKHHTRRDGELRFITPAGPEELTLQALSPELRNYRVFIDRR